MDLKTLFHNPDELTDGELAILRDKMRISKSLPWVSAFIGGFCTYYIERNILRRGYSFVRIFAVAGLCFVLGGYGSYQVKNSLPR